MVRRAVRILATIVLSMLVAIGVAWAALALWLDGPQSRTLAGMLVVGLVIVTVLSLALIRPLLRGLAVSILPIVAVALWWSVDSAEQ